MLKQFTIAVIAACPFPHGRGTPLRIQRLSEALVMAGQMVCLSLVLTTPWDTKNMMPGLPCRSRCWIRYLQLN